VANIKDKKISVIMSVYNGMPYLKEAVKSILSQSYRTFEFIIVDDASTDGSWDYLKNIKDERLTLIKNKKNRGLSASLNKALKIAKGKYIARMDADDISKRTRIEAQINFLEKNPKIALCGTWAKKIDKDGKIIGNMLYPISPEEIKKKIALFNPIIHPSIMARKTFFDKLGGYREEFDGAEDYDLLARGVHMFKYANIPEELLMLRFSKTRRSQKSMHKMDKLDLKVKLNLIREGGITPSSFFALAKKLAFIYLLPSSVKSKLAEYFKKA
jgi:glycosyltransferase involved in cell wall biosynthesis